MNLRDFRNRVFPDLNSELISTNGKGIFQSKIPEILAKFEEVEFGCEQFMITATSNPVFIFLLKALHLVG